MKLKIIFKIFLFFQHNMSTAVDKDAIRRAYDDVRSDTSETEW